MAEEFDCKSKKSFRSNARKAVPLMAEKFFSQVCKAMHHPERAKELHEMRLSGKPLRYLMELCEPYLGKDFRNCFKEIKNFVALAGDIHDLDLILQALALFKRELEIFGGSARKTGSNITARSVSPLVKDFREKRARLANQLSAAAKRWQLSGFKERLIASLGQ
jgi:CHAD domain-containing protein